MQCNTLEIAESVEVFTGFCDKILQLVKLVNLEVSTWIQFNLK